MSITERMPVAERMRMAERVPIDEHGECDDLHELFASVGAPVFEEPWQAQVFAATVELSRAGHFTWEQWAQALSTELAAAGLGDVAADYYRHWLDALEKMVVRVGVATTTELATLGQAWRDAFEATAHGASVELDAKVIERLRE